MGMNLLTHGWTVEKNTAGANMHELAEPLHHILNALPDVWFTDERMQTLDEYEYYTPLEGDESGAHLSNLRNALTIGCEDYVLHLSGMHRQGTSYPIPGSEMWFHIAGGGSWGDDPYEGWQELGIFLAACWLLRELAEAAGYVCGGLPPLKPDLATVRTKVEQVREEAIEQRYEHDRNSEDDGVRLAWHLWDSSVSTCDEVLLIIDGLV